MVQLTHTEMVERFYARDAASRLRFVVGVVTTGIYCLPTCTAKKPRADNVRFFDTVDQARRAGLRACKRCRPDAVHAGRDPELEALEAALETLRRAPGEVADARALAALAGCGGTKLGALTRRHHHATPRERIVRARVDWARRALARGRRSVLDIGLEAGFASASAFHENFRAATGLTPGEYRAFLRQGRAELALPRGYPSGHVLRALGRDPDGRTERVHGRRVTRALVLGGRPALLTAELGARSLSIEVSARRPLDADERAQAHAQVLRLFGLQLDPRPFERRARTEPQVRRLIAGRRGLRIPQTPNAFEGLVWSIVGQQVNLAFAFTCRNRLIDLAGRRAGGGLRAHPTPEAVAELDYADLTALQFSRRKAEYLIDSARRIAAGELDLEGLAAGSATAAEATLLAVRGLGRWSTHYILMRSLGFGDCVPVGDAGLVRALAEFHGLDARPGPEETLEHMAPFAPHRSLATFHLWKTLGEPA